jgi:L,D-peptidoglycan transpeptidase YkuD (ErfK/YbiS/YcfS/YnhG family)
VKASKAVRQIAVRHAGLSRLVVHPRNGTATGRLVAGSIILPCTIGKNGAAFAKREGDGRTPRGTFAILDWYAPPGPGRLARLPFVPRPILRGTGWCDDPSHPSYNRPVKLPLAAGHEGMARRDGKYDIVGVMSYNMLPRVRGRGSAIFFHINESRTKGTEGCVALTRADMRRLLPRLARRAVVVVR